MTEWPEWWDWELDLGYHVTGRMADRHFSEVELRDMMEQAFAVRRSHVPGRWIIETRHYGRAWHVVVEPDDAGNVLSVVTAYRVRAR